MFILDVTNEPKVLWECKHCAQMNEADIIKFFSANEMKQGLLCVHCHNEFYVGMRLLDTRSPTLRAPVQSEQGGWTCQKCEWLNGELWQECPNCKSPRPTRSDGG